MAKATMGIDQYGATYHDLGAHPRTALMRKLGRSRAAKMYRDTKDGPRHVGYIVAGLWIEIFDVAPWRKVDA